jgi:hypothetical protein
MIRKLTAVFLSLLLCVTAVSCGDNSTKQSPNNFENNTSYTPSKLNDGKYPVQQASYDDGNGEYSLMLLNTPAGSSPVYKSTNLQMARLTDAEISANEKTYLQVTNNQPVMHLTEDFKIEYVHNVAENQTNAQTGKTETIIVRRESSFWTPFAGALAGQALGSLLFTPQYYIPPVYQPGGVITGYGGYGRSYNDAVTSYQNRYQSPPAVERNRQIVRTSGGLRTSNSNSSKITRRQNSNQNKGTGSGIGSSTLNSSNKSTGVKRTPSFGSNSRRSTSRSFGGSRRRR